MTYGSATKHTPGPWFVDAEHDGYASISSNVGSWLGFARVVVRMDDGQPTETGQANARLIAAAPDMLAALSMWHAALRGKAMSADEQAAWNAGRDAIAKAEGRE